MQIFISYFRFADCPRSNLFGKNKHTMEADPDKSGIFWFSFGGTRNSLAEVQALIRPTNWESVSKNEPPMTS